MKLSRSSKGSEGGAGARASPRSTGEKGRPRRNASTAATMDAPYFFIFAAGNASNASPSAAVVVGASTAMTLMCSSEMIWNGRLPNASAAARRHSMTRVRRAFASCAPLSSSSAAAAGGARLGVECAPRVVLRQHQAAVKALSWCPMHRNLLASGGGTADRSIKFWNAHTGALLHSVDTGSQVCALLWSRHHKEIVSSHGFSQNQLCLWRYPSMTKLCELTGHTARVLHLAQSPDGETVVSAAADETLRFWSIFGGSPTRQKSGRNGMRELRLSSVGDGLSIR
mmetsp:Transcript_7158/g.22545  ORF Transcript_7158/g.22545 Transcript_7158/m.22545 type:complete len:283 (+) Transcript_7158:158-1006(+)